MNKINVFSQTRKKRIFVGTLSRDNKHFYFHYDKKYSRLKNAIPLGPEFDLWKESFSSKTLFPSLSDRIPSKINSAYKDYCKQWNISPNETDPFILLTTIGHRGPSTFIFEPAIERTFQANSIKAFRNYLGLTQEEFALLLDMAQITLIRLEQGHSTNETLLTYIELVEKTPKTLLWLLEKRGQHLHDKTVERLKRLI